MNYELRIGEKLSKGIRRIIGKQFERICAELHQHTLKHDRQAVHKARKELKKLRSLLRLFRKKPCEKVYRKESRRLQKIARGLSPLRNAAVMLKTLENLRCHCRGRTSRSAFLKLHRVLARQRRNIFRKCFSSRELESKLEVAWKHLKRGLGGKFKWPQLCRGVRRSYERGLQAFHEAQAAPTSENLHEWRKRAKDLSHHFCLMKPVQNEALTALAHKLELLGDYLGDDHDLAMLDAAAAKAGLAPAESEALRELIFARRIKLQQAALELGCRIYVQKPRVFARQIKPLEMALKR